MKTRTRYLIDFLKKIEQKFLYEVDKEADDYYMNEIKQRLMEYDELKEAMKDITGQLIDLIDMSHGNNK